MAFPILLRVWRTQWREDRGFVLLLTILSAFAVLMVWRYADEAAQSSAADAQTRIRVVGAALWRQSAWLQSAVALLVAPALTAGSIAREREHGLLENLQMSPLAPFQIALEKWLGALAPVIIILGALAPLNFLLVLSGGASPQAFYALLGFQILSAACGAAIGLACSAWARHAHLALRSAYGYIVLWLLGSGAAALVAGETLTGPILPGFRAPDYLIWFGRTNPILAAQEMISGSIYQAKWPFSVGAMLLIIAFSLWTTTRALRRPLALVPFMVAKPKRGTAPQTVAAGHFEVPVVGALPFANPVTGREVRSKFRLRQPPVAVVVVEVFLALAVFYFYLRTIWSALTDPGAREIIFWGVTFVGLVVTLISCAIMGANGFSREHEGGTWEGLRLSMLRPREIVTGKVVGIALTCALFSLPIWPLLLPCVRWSEQFRGDGIAPSQLVAVVLIWIGSVMATTLWGLWIGRRTRKSSAASGAALGLGTVWLIGVPLLSRFFLYNEDSSLGTINPFVAISLTMNSYPRHSDADAWGLPFLLVALAASLIFWALLESGMRREFGRD